MQFLTYNGTEYIFHSKRKSSRHREEPLDQNTAGQTAGLEWVSPSNSAACKTLLGWFHSLCAHLLADIPWLRHFSHQGVSNNPVTFTTSHNGILWLPCRNSPATVASTVLLNRGEDSITLSSGIFHYSKARTTRTTAKSTWGPPLNHICRNVPFF